MARTRMLNQDLIDVALKLSLDQDEAMDLADRVALLRDGRLEQIGAPADLEAKPASAFVFQFLGDANALPCRWVDGRAQFDGFSAPAVGTAGAGEITAWFRPHETEVVSEGGGVDITVTSVLTTGGVARAEGLDASGRLFQVDVARTDQPEGFKPGGRLKVRPTRVFVFDEAAR